MIPALRLLLGVTLGFFLPGFLFSRLIRCGEHFVSSFIISIVLLFHVVFWLDVFSVPLTFWDVAAVLVIVCIVISLFVVKQTVLPATRATFGGMAEPGDLRLLIGGISLISLLLVVRSLLSPLSGFDTLFRWNFLPQQIFRYHNFNFYPPLKPTDFKTYFYVDAIPPMIGFAYWLIYAAVGNIKPALTGIFVSLQFAVLVVQTIKLGKILSSAMTGLLAGGFLVCSPLLFWSVFMGQETGITALSLASTIYFLLLARNSDYIGPVIMAAFASAAGGLAREYGVAFILCGIFCALWLKLGIRKIAYFLFISIGLIAPWYLRNWILSGNPFYSNPVGQLFAVNKIHVALLETYDQVLGFGGNAWSHAATNVLLLLEYAPLQFCLGLIFAVLLVKRFGYLLFSACIVVLLWIFSIGRTGGGFFWAMRVLSPAVVLLSVTGANGLQHFLRGRSPQKLILITFPVLLTYSFVYDLVIPFQPRYLPLSRWTTVAFHSNRPGADEMKAKMIAPQLKRLGCRILSDDNYMHAALFPYGVELVPVWSPEVSFLFDGKTTMEDAEKKMIALNIKAVMYSPDSLNSLYLNRFSFISNVRKQWIRYLWAPGSEVYLLKDHGKIPSSM